MFQRGGVCLWNYNNEDQIQNIRSMTLLLWNLCFVKIKAFFDSGKHWGAFIHVKLNSAFVWSICKCSLCLFVIGIYFTPALPPCFCLCVCLFCPLFCNIKQLSMGEEEFDCPLKKILGHLSSEGLTRAGRKNLIRLNDDWNGLIYIFCMHTLHTWSLLSTGSSG